MHTSTLPSLDAVVTSFNNLQIQKARLDGQAATLRAQEAGLTKAIGLAKARIALAPEVAEVLEFLQNRAHTRAVGDFEELLSAFVEDVFPEGGSVSLKLSTERGVPALDILLDNGGFAEDVLEDNGGAMTNVVSTGLVYAARSRTNTRPLVVLDEPDCWLKPERVPDFTKVIADVANTTGCQTLLISHHTPSMMVGDYHLIELYEEDREVVHGAKGPKDMAIPATRSLTGYREWDDDAQVGLRWLECTNLRQHKMTRVELCPGANALVGDNNLGKSTLFTTALRALALGDMTDTMIRHYSDKFMVRVGLENKVTLEVQRNRAGSPKVVFRRYEDGVLTHEESPRTRGGVPEFVRTSLNIDYVDDLDIHLRKQKRPVFLLDEPASRRAQLLSVGKESGTLQALAERQRLNLRRDKDQLKRDEPELTQVLRQLAALAPLSGLAALVDVAKGLQSDLTAGRARQVELQALVARMSELEAKAAVARAHEKDLAVAVPTPVLHDTKQLDTLVGRLTQSAGAARVVLPELPATAAQVEALMVRLQSASPLQQLIARLGTHQGAVYALRALPAQDIQPPVMHTTQDLYALLQRVAKATARTRLLAQLPEAPQAPVIQINQDGKATVQMLETRQAALAKQQQELQATLKALEAAQAAHKALEQELGGVCPLCNAQLADHDHP